MIQSYAEVLEGESEVWASSERSARNPQPGWDFLIWADGWGSNPHKCLRLQCFFFSYASYHTICVRWSSLSAEGKMYVTETRSSVKLKKKSAWRKWLLLIDIYTKLKSLKLSPFVAYNQRLNIQKNAEASWDKPHLLEIRKKGKKYFQHCFIAILRLQHTNLMLV